MILSFFGMLIELKGWCFLDFLFDSYIEIHSYIEITSNCVLVIIHDCLCINSKNWISIHQSILDKYTIESEVVKKQNGFLLECLSRGSQTRIKYITDSDADWDLWIMQYSNLHSPSSFLLKWVVPVLWESHRIELGLVDLIHIYTINLTL